jgi:hypothetical protein
MDLGPLVDGGLLVWASTVTERSMSRDIALSRRTVSISPSSAEPWLGAVRLPGNVLFEHAEQLL